MGWRPRRLEGHQRAHAIPPRYGSCLSPPRCLRPNQRTGSRARDIRPLSSSSPPNGERPRRHLRAAGPPADPAGLRRRLPRRPAAGWDLRRRLGARTRPTDPPPRRGDTTIRHGQHRDPHAPHAADERRRRATRTTPCDRPAERRRRTCRCHSALELDGADHGYGAEEWLPTVYDIAGPLLRSARLDTEPPTLVQILRRRSAGCRRPSPSSTKPPRKPRPASPRRSSATRRLELHRRRVTERRTRLVASGSSALRSDRPQDGDEPVDRGDQHTALGALMPAARTMHRTGTASRHATRCDHHRVDVPSAWPRD